MKLCRTFGVIVLFVSSLPPLAAATDLASVRPALTISVSAIEPYSTPRFDGYEDQIIREVFRRIGYGVKLQHQPDERMLRNLNDGIDDGTASRIGGLKKTYPNFVQFTEKLEDRQYGAFVLGPEVQLTGWRDLAPYNVALINGWKIFERNTTHAKSVTKVRNLRQLFLLLKNHRADVVLAHRWVGLQMARDLDIPNVRFTEPALALREVFFYLHRKHRRLIPRASAALHAMKQDGTYRRIFNQTLGKLANWNAGKNGKN